jgi:FixJ family two-component response regulator
MCKLSRREEQILKALKGAFPSVVARDLGITEKSISTYLSRIKRKEAQARKFLEYLREFKDVLHPAKQYKGVRVAPSESENQ